MKQENVLLSIVIPTYNRYKYLLGSIDAIVDTICSDVVEIVIQDNTEDNATIIEYLKKKNDYRIKYFHEKKRVTVSENCSKGISNSVGKYVCLIGDDDSMCKDVVQLVECMNKREIDACNFDATVYHWPDLKAQMPMLDSFISPEVHEKIDILDSKQILQDEMKRGLQSIYSFPRAYHAIVRRSVLDKIKERTGTYFPGPSPDMANAVLCCIYVKNQIKIGVPMMVSGYGLSSGGGLGRQRKHTGSLKGKDWLPTDVENRWCKKIPLLWLGCTIWPASAVEALNTAKESAFLETLDYGSIYGETIIQAKYEGLVAVLKCRPRLAEYGKMFKYIVGRVYEKLIKKEKEKIINNEVGSLIEATMLQNQLNSKVDIVALFEKYEN